MIDIDGQEYRTGKSFTWLVEQVAKETGVIQDDVADVVRSAIDNIVREVAAGGKVSLTNFGSFDAVNRGGFMGRNPATGQSIWINAVRRIKFKAFPRTVALVEMQSAVSEDGLPVTTSKIPKNLK